MRLSPPLLGRIATPLFTMLDVEKILPRFRPLAYDEPREVAPGVDPVSSRKSR